MPSPAEVAAVRENMVRESAMLHRDAEVLSEEAGEDGTLVRARVGEREFAIVEAFRVKTSERAAG